MRYEVTGVITAAEKDALLDLADTRFKDSPALFAASVTLVNTTYQEYQRVIVPEDPGPPIVPAHPEFRMTSAALISPDAAVVGTAIGDSCAPQLAFVVSFSTTLPGPQHRGRVFTPPPPELVVDGAGGVSDAATRRTWVQEIAEGVEGSVVGTDIDHIVHSLVSGDTTEVIAYRGRTRIDTQRRRRTEG